MGLTDQWSTSASDTGYFYPDAATLKKELVSAGMSEANATKFSTQLGGKPIQSEYSGSTPNAKDLLNGIYSTGLNTKGGSTRVAAQLLQAFLNPYKLNAADFANANSTKFNKLIANFNRVKGIADQYKGQFGSVPAGIFDFGGATLTPAQQILNESILIQGREFAAQAAATATASTKISADQNAQAILSQWGLQDLADKIDTWVFKNGITNTKELMNMVRQTNEYKKAFAGLDEHNKTFPQQMTEAQYLANKQAYIMTAQAAGLPDGFFTNKEVAKLIAGGTSPAEFSRRIAMGYQAVQALPQDLQAQFMQQHNVGKGGLLAYFLDPERGESALTRQALAANLGYSAQTAGVRGFTSDQAADLAEMVRLSGAGQTVQQDPYNALTLGKAQQVLQTVGKEGALTTAGLPGTSAPTVDTRTLIGSQIAGFEGTTMPQAQAEVARAEQARVAPFEKGGGYAETGKGVTGLGSARS